MNLAIILLLLGIDAVTFGPGNRFHLEHSTGNGSFGMQSHGIMETLEGNRTKFYPLPQSTPEQYARLRPEDIKINPLTPGSYEREEFIGPWQIENANIWFGNNFYDSEGSHGVGAFGFFDTAARKYTLYSPPEVARYQIGAILVQPDIVWLGLERFVEDISPDPGGIASWNRTTHEAHRYPLEFAVSGIRPEGDSLRLKNGRGGYAIFHDGDLHRFLSNGKPVAKFPPLPSHY
jgi:hypothetical protein